MTEEEAADLTAFMKSGDYTIDVTHKGNLHLAMVLPAVLKLVPFFYDRVWRVLEFAEPSLITSDEPVALVGSNPEAPGEAGGLGTAREIVFPLDPRRALVMVDPDRATEQGRSHGTPEQARIVNRHVAFSGHRYLVRTPGTNPLADLVLPRRAPSVYSVGSVLGMSFNESTEARQKQVARIRKYLRRKPPPR